jgi:hypothetical protein
MDTDTDRFERIPLTEWDRLHDALAAFCEGGVEVGGEAETSAAADGRLTCRAGGATFTVARTGEVTAGMPLHGVEVSGVEAVGVDHTERELLVETDDTRYVFRHP